MAPQVVEVSAERIAQELRRMLVHPSRTRAMDLALETGLLAAILPPVVRMKGLFQGKAIQPEGDLWDHTRLVLSLLPPDSPFTLAFAALLHDVGKPLTRVFQHGRYSFHNHEQAGGAARRPALPSAQALEYRARTDHLARRFSSISGRPSGSASRSSSGCWPNREFRSSSNCIMPTALASTGDTQHVDYCRYYLVHQPDGPINPPPLLTGHDLVRHGLQPGPRFAELLERIREGQLEGQIHSKKEALEWVDRQPS